MSTIIRTEGRPWIWWAAGGGILIATLVLIGALVLPNDAPSGTSAPAPEGKVAVGPDGEPLPQAKWEVKVFPAGVGKPTKAQKKVVSAQREPLQATVATLFDSLLLDDRVAGGVMTKEAAKALERSKLTLPKGMTEVQTMRRVAKVGVDDKATHAAAKVVLTFKGSVDGKVAKLRQRATLWLEREGNGWKVIAFEGLMEKRK